MAVGKPEAMSSCFSTDTPLPLPGAIERLVQDIEELGPRAVVVPRIPALDVESWTLRGSVGDGFCMDLKTLECCWLSRRQLRRRGSYYENPASIGCCLVVSRQGYEEAWGFDPDMRQWGVEDIDFGLKAWTCGFELLLDDRATIGHRFQHAFTSYVVTDVGVLVNKIRMARKNFGEENFQIWVEYTRGVEPEKTWNEAWTAFLEDEESAEREREYLFAHRVRDENDYAERFGLRWPPRRAVST